MMIRSDIGVTALERLLTETVCPSELSRPVFTTCLDCVLPDRGVFRFFVIACPFETGYMDLNTHHIKPNLHVQSYPIILASAPSQTGLQCHRRREELPLDRPRPRHQQEHRRGHRQTPLGEPLDIMD